MKHRGDGVAEKPRPRFAARALLWPMAHAMKDIETLDDCESLVNAFYRTARQDPLLGPVFELRVEGRWPEHLRRMTHFWGTVLLGLALYDGKPLERHDGLPIEPSHFARWVSLWSAEVDRCFAGPRADFAKRAAVKMALRMGAARNEGTRLTV